MTDERRELLDRGKDRIHAWLAANPSVPSVALHVYDLASWRVSACAYYRANVIHICVERCAIPGRAGRGWSWPGYPVDRTPYGVLAHELGHHVDWHVSERKKVYGGDFSSRIAVETREERLTSYCPNHQEWFAELFKLFVTNPDLLWRIRPRTHNVLAGRFNPVQPLRSWEEELVAHDAPDRTLQAARNRIRRAS